MKIFKIQENNSLEAVREESFKLEKNIQTLTEQNLETIFGLEFIASEFSLNSFRIDTLSYDKEAKCFVIIEYKRDSSFSVIDQGYAYLSLMLNNKAEFILEYNERKNRTLNRSSVDWSQSRILFVAPAYTVHQKEAINFKDLPIELWEIKRYKNKTVSFSQIKNHGVQASIKTIKNNEGNIATVTKEIKIYSEDEHLSKTNDSIKELYEKLKQGILNFGSFDIKATKVYIAFVLNRNVVDVHILKSGLKVWVNLKKGELDDPKELARDVSSTGHWGNGDYEIVMHNDDDLEYILSLIKQSVKKNSE